MTALRRWPPEVLLVAVLTLVVAVGAGALSWSALTTFARAANVWDRIAWIYPVVVDGQMAVATVAGFVLRRAPLGTRAYVWAMIGASIAVSVVGNAAHATGAQLAPAAAAAASAVPALALAASLHLAIVIVRAVAPAPTRARTATDPPTPRARRPRAPKPRAERAPAGGWKTPRVVHDGVQMSASQARKRRARDRALEGTHAAA